MKTRLNRLLPILACLTLGGLLFCEPLLANKFETIGGGVQGSTRIKLEYLRVVAYVTSGIFLMAGVLAILLHNRNAMTLNYTMWKSSALLFFLLSAACILAALLLH